MKTVIILGDVNIDIILSGMLSPPAWGKEILADNCVMKLGGSAANVAAMLAMNGCPVRLFGCVGNDSNGRYLINSLEEFRIETNTICIADNETTGVTVSLTYPHERMYISHLGTVASTKLENLSDGYLRKGSHLHLTSYFLQKGLRASVGGLLKQAKEIGMTTSLDPGGDPSGEWDLSDLQGYLQYLDWFMPNADEMKGVANKRNIEDAVINFAREVTGLVVKMGPQGAITRYEGRVEHWPGLDVQAIDTTCAGDCFDAGFLYSLTGGNPLSEAVHRGNEYGAQAVLNVGLPPHKIT